MSKFDFSIAAAIEQAAKQAVDVAEAYQASAKANKITSITINHGTPYAHTLHLGKAPLEIKGTPLKDIVESPTSVSIIGPPIPGVNMKILKSRQVGASLAAIAAKAKIGGAVALSEANYAELKALTEKLSPQTQFSPSFGAKWGLSPGQKLVEVAAKLPKVAEPAPQAPIEFHALDHTKVYLVALPAGMSATSAKQLTDHLKSLGITTVVTFAPVVVKNIPSPPDPPKHPQGGSPWG